MAAPETRKMGASVAWMMALGSTTSRAAGLAGFILSFEETFNAAESCARFVVLAHRVGKSRNFLRGFLLTVGTVGLYAVYWNYKAQDELYKQFELGREDRDDGVVWYILGLIFPPFLFAYLWTFSSNVAYVRERMMMKRRTTAASFVGLVGAGMAVFLAGSLAFFIATSIPVEPVDSTPAADASALVVFVGFIMFIALSLVAYWRLQRDLNEVWVAYEARVKELAARPPLGRVQEAPRLPSHPTYWADLAPNATPEAPAAPPEDAPPRAP